MCACVLADGDGTTVTGAGSAAQPYVIDTESNVVLSDTVPVTDPPIEGSPAVALDPDTGLPVAYFVPGDGWHAVAGGAGGVEVYKGEGDPNVEIGDPLVSTALYYDTGTPNANRAEVTDTYPYAIWIWDSSVLPDGEWQPYPVPVMACAKGTSSITVPTGTWTRLTSAATEVLDTAGMHPTDSTTGRMYAPYDGYYQISGRVTFAAVTGEDAGLRQIRLRRDNTTTLEFAHSYHAAGTMDEVSLPFLYGCVYVPAGSYVEVQAWQDSSASVEATLAEFTVRLIKPDAPPVGS